MANISIKQIEAFVQVAEQASFRGAAHALRTTQPNISARIASLEQQLGQRLMERDAGSVHLTPKGAQLLQKARKILDARDDLVAAADATALFDGTLRLGVTELIVHTWLGEYLAALKKKYPSISTELTVDLSSNLSGALFNRSIDLAFQSGPFNRRASGSQPLGHYPMAWAAAPGLNLGKRALALDTLCQHPIITHARETTAFAQIAQQVAGHRHAKLVPSTNLSACLRMAIEGLGIACLPRAMLQSELHAGRLELVEYPWLPDELTFYARFHHDTAPYHVKEAASLAANYGDS